MAVKRWRWPRRRGGGKRRHDPEEAAARLAPLEETEAFRDSVQADTGKRGDDTIVVGRNSIRMPEYLGGQERDAEGTFRIDRPVAVLLAVVLAFIAFIAWQISQMPEK